jgi:hypothetical protein
LYKTNVRNPLEPEILYRASSERVESFQEAARLSNRVIKAEKGRAKFWLLIVLTLVFIIGSGIYFLAAQTRESKRLEQVLNERFGWAENHTPAINGAIPPQRLDQFLLVRQAVQSGCADYQSILNSLIELEAMDSEQGSQEGDKVSSGVGNIKNIFSTGSKMLQFTEHRNRALVNANMGFGEYMYIYLAAYGEQLANEPNSPYSEMDEAYISARTREEIVQILRNQLVAIASSDPGPHSESLVSQLQAEIEAVKSESHPAPWPSGPGEAALESLAPYRKQINDLYCSGIVRIELLQKNRGLQFEG